MKLPTALLPKSPPLHLETWSLDEVTAQLTLCLTSTQLWGCCPRCRRPTRRIHSHYQRTVAESPLGPPPRPAPSARTEVFLQE